MHIAAVTEVHSRLLPSLETLHVSLPATIPGNITCKSAEMQTKTHTVNGIAQMLPVDSVRSSQRALSIHLLSSCERLLDAISCQHRDLSLLSTFVHRCHLCLLVPSASLSFLELLCIASIASQPKAACVMELSADMHISFYSNPVLQAWLP